MSYQAGSRLELSIDGPSRQSIGSVLLRFLMAIPSFIMLYIYQLIAGILVFFGWFTALFGNGRMSPSTEVTVIKTLNYQARVMAFMWWLTPEKPAGLDVPSQTVHLSITPAESTKGSILLRYLLAVPGMIMAMVGGFVMYFYALFMFFTLLTKGELSAEQQQFATRAIRFFLRLQAYLWLITPVAPSGLFGDPDEAGAGSGSLAATA